MANASQADKLRGDGPTVTLASGREVKVTLNFDVFRLAERERPGGVYAALAVMADIEDQNIFDATGSLMLAVLQAVPNSIPRSQAVEELDRNQIGEYYDALIEAWYLIAPHARPKSEGTDPNSPAPETGQTDGPGMSGTTPSPSDSAAAMATSG